MNRRRMLTCTECEWPLHPAAAAGGFITHPGCDIEPEPGQPLATVHQLRIPTTEGDDDDHEQPQGPRPRHRAPRRPSLRR